MAPTKKKAQKSAKKSSKKAKKKPAKVALKTPKKAQSVSKNDKNKKRPISKKAGKRDRSDSVAAAVDAAQGAFGEIKPPEHIKLRLAEIPYWKSIVNEFAFNEWTDHTLEMAVILCRYIYDLEKEQRKLRPEGTVLERIKVIPAVIDKETGNEIKPPQEVVTSTYINPRLSVIDMHTKNVMQLRRSLSMHGRATEGEQRDVSKRRAKAKGIENDMANIGDGMGLIAFPKTVN